MKWKFLLIAFVLLCSCSEQKKKTIINNMQYEKGYNSVRIDLFPQIIDDGCTEAVSLDSTNRFACTRGTIFSFGTLTDDLKLQFEAVKEHFAYSGVGDLGADPDGSLMWGKEGNKRLWMIDTKTMQTIDTIPEGSRLYKSGEYIWRIRPTSLPGRIYFFRYSPAANKNYQSRWYALFDYDKRTEIFIPETPLKDPPVVTCWPLDSITYLISSFIEVGENKDQVDKWYLADLSIKGFINWRTNKLTDSLTSKAFIAEDLTHHNCVNSQHRMIVGHYDIGEREFNGVARWNKDFDSVAIEPLIMQCPPNYSFGQMDWLFSPDGNWLAAVAEEYLPETNSKDDPQLVFYHIDPKYPQGISPPVFGTKGDTRDGCFVNHSKLGMVYLDFGTGYNMTMLYKMSDLLPIIADKMLKMAK